MGDPARKQTSNVFELRQQIAELEARVDSLARERDAALDRAEQLEDQVQAFARYLDECGAVRRWKTLESEGKLLWWSLREDALRESSGTIHAEVSGLGARYGRGERSGRRAMWGDKPRPGKEAKEMSLVANGLVRIDDSDAGIIFLPDPLDVRRARLCASQSDGQAELDLDAGQPGTRPESEPADQVTVGSDAAVVESRPPPLPRTLGEDGADAAGTAVVVPQPPAVVAQQPPSRYINIDIELDPSNDIDISASRSPTGWRQRGSSTGHVPPKSAPPAARTATTAGGCGATTAAAPLLDAATQAVERMLARPPGPSLTERNSLADQLARQIVDTLADPHFPPSYAVHVAHAVWIEDELPLDPVKSLLAQIATGLTEKGVRIGSRGAFFRQSIRNQAAKAAAHADRHGRSVSETFGRLLARAKTR